MAPLAMKTSSLTKRRKLTISAAAGLAGTAALFAFSNGGERPAFDPERDLSASVRGEMGAELGFGSRSLANTVEAYDTDQSVDIPSWYDNVANVWDVLVTDDQPAMWYMPRVGGNTLAKVMCNCLGFVCASPMPRILDDGVGLEGTALKINTLSDGGKYVNLDMSDQNAFAAAANYNLVVGNVADVIVTSHLQPLTTLFQQTHRGRLFVMLRHPVKRAIDLFFYRQKATFDPKNFDEDVATMKLLEYAASSHHVDNYVVRTLVGIDGFGITPADVDTAKHILRRKFIIGIAEEKFFDVSVVRLEKYFGWWESKGVLTDMTVNHCHFDKITKGGHFGSHPKFNSKTPEYQKLAARNWADMELYMWAKGLFKRQAVLPDLFLG